MHATALATLVSILLVPASSAQPLELEITRVALFSSGIGYFECTTEVDGTVTAELKFRTSEINDVLKSLVVEDLGGGTIGIVSYASRDPIEKTLRSFAVDITGKPTLPQLLDQLRGEPVEITHPRALKGVIVGVEKSEIAVGEHIITNNLLNLLTDSGLEQISIADLSGLRLTNSRIDAELRKALQTLASGRDADKKSVLLRFEGTGRRPVRVGYLLEAPVWKTTYRLVLTDSEKPFLQGWATIENATERDWNNVNLSLVSGWPISFRMDLYTPLYVQRPLEQMPVYASLRPPEFEGAVGPPPPAPEMKVNAPAHDARGKAKSTAADVEALSRRAPEEPQMLAPPPRARELRLEDTGVEALAEGREAGELFEYPIKTPVSIARQQSAMLPIVNQRIDGTRVSVYNRSVHARYPVNALELVNTTGLNLMQGPVTVFDGGLYAGDAKLPDLRPDEKRLVAYAVDLSTEVIVKEKPAPEQIVSLKIARGVLVRRNKYVDEKEYLIKNKSAKEKTVILEQPYTQEWKVVTPREAYETTGQLLRFRTSVPPGQTTSYPVVLERLADQSVALADCGLDEIHIYLRSQKLAPAVEEALKRVVSLRSELDHLARERSLHERTLKEHLDDQARVRENLKTLPSNTDAYQQQIARFTDLESRIDAARKQIAAARQAEDLKRQELEQYLLNLSVE
jgi:hypothetical protein